MCGIAGFQGALEETLLLRMANAIEHRGPDDGGYLHDAKSELGLAHRRLSIIDLSPSGRQPMWDAQGAVCIVYNGELYNFRELRSELEAEGWRFRSQSDTEVLLNLYRKMGVDFLSRLNGIFAFALWDPAKQALLLARDPFGVKPLYYSETKCGFLFASELKALTQYHGLAKDIDYTALQSYLTFLWSPGSRTPFRHVSKLPPGHAILVAGRRIQRCWRFYEVPFDQPIELMAEQDAADAVFMHLREAVRRQMVADVPVGTFLSGGLDSSAITAFAREFSPGRLQSFTIDARFNEMGNHGTPDDLPYARRVAEHLDVDLSVIQVGPEMIDEIDNLVYHLDEPQADLAAINVLFISALARKAGIKVLLSGAGGDDIFTGYRRHFALASERYWRFLPQPVRHAISLLHKVLPPAHPTLRRMAKALRYAGLEGDERIASYFYWMAPEALQDLYGSAMRRQLDGAVPGAPLLESLGALPRNMSPLNRMLYLEIKHFLTDHNLNYTDKMSMAVGVETRVPLLDPDLVRLACRLPISLKQRGRTGKYIFKRSMERVLPREIIYRPKTGFGVPLRQWLKGPLAPLIEDTLSHAAIARRGLFNPVAVHALIEANKANRIDGSHIILSLFCIEAWCRSFVDTIPVRSTLPSEASIQRVAYPTH